MCTRLLHALVIHSAWPMHAEVQCTLIWWSQGLRNDGTGLCVCACGISAIIVHIAIIVISVPIALMTLEWYVIELCAGARVNSHSIIHVMLIALSEWVPHRVAWCQWHSWALTHLMQWSSHTWSNGYDWWLTRSSTQRHRCAIIVSTTFGSPSYKHLQRWLTDAQSRALIKCFPHVCLQSLESFKLISR